MESATSDCTVWAHRDKEPPGFPLDEFEGVGAVEVRHRGNRGSGAVVGRTQRCHL